MSLAFWALSTDLSAAGLGGGGGGGLFDGAGGVWGGLFCCALVCCGLELLWTVLLGDADVPKSRAGPGFTVMRYRVGEGAGAPGAGS